MPTDLELLAAIRLRDAEALATLYDKYGTKVFSLSVAIVGEGMAAQEATQDTFLKVWAQVEKYRHDAIPFSAWIMMIARQTAIDRLRYERRRTDNNDALEGEGVLEHRDVLAENNARWQDLRMVLDDLPTDQRVVLLLAYYRGLSQSEIAEHLKMPLGTVKTRTRAALIKLRDMLER